MGLVIRAIGSLLQVIEILIFVRVIISWLPISRDNPLIQILYQLTEPILGPIRAIIQKSAIGGGMMFDFSAIIALILIRLIRMNLFRLML